jgi:hypothetical protein
MKLMVIGYAQHGKDSVCNLLGDMFGLRHISSSLFCLRKCVRKDLEKAGIFYASDEDCYADRANHRPAWHDSIANYNRDDPARLGRELYEQYDIYCGLRSELEFRKLKEERVFDVAFWVDRSKFVEPEPYSSCKLFPSFADYIIDNNGSFTHLREEVRRAYTFAIKDIHIA